MSIQNELRRLADELDEQRRLVDLPKNITISEALSRLRQKDSYTSINMHVMEHSAGSVKVDFQVQTSDTQGVTHGDTLAEAVSKVIAARNAIENPPTPRDVIAIADEAMAEPMPF